MLRLAAGLGQDGDDVGKRLAGLPGEIQSRPDALAARVATHRVPAHLASGRLKAIAIGGATRLPLLPEVPTFAESGFADVPANAWFGLFAPAGTTRDVINTLHAEVTRILREPEFMRTEIVAKGYEPVAGTPDEFTRFLAADRLRSARAVKISGARAD